MTQPRVLVVDDEPAIRQAFALLLARHGFDVVTAATRDETHAILTSRRIDALLLDLRLRNSEPGDVIFDEAVRHDPGLRERTIFMTGDISDEAYLRLLAAGRPYLMKPFDSQVLIDSIRALVQPASAPPAPVSQPVSGSAVPKSTFAA
jgi:DNA-binding response OmpR family regulator